MHTSIRPVFIIGAARSGTKFLRSVLAFSRDCSVVPYDINYVWRFGNERHPNDALPADLLSSQSRIFIRGQLPCLAEPRVRERALLIEKTVSNGLRVDFVKAVFPEGRFIHLVRDGRDVIESAMRMWNDPLDWTYLLRKVRRFPFANYRYAGWYARNLLEGWLSRRKGLRIWGPRYPGIEGDVASRSVLEVCARQWSEAVRRTDEHFQDIAADQRMTIRYEALTRDAAEVERLCAFLGVSDPERVVEGYRQTVAPPRRTRWPPAADDVDLERALAIAAPELRRLGYLATDARLHA